MSKFKVGDIVAAVTDQYVLTGKGVKCKVMSVKPFNVSVLDDKSFSSGHKEINRKDGFTVNPHMFELVERPQYEDKWELNDGSVEIPDDADKLEKDGSVVAFRRVKVPEWKFGDELRGKSGLTFIFICRDDNDQVWYYREGQTRPYSTHKNNLKKIE